jgi:Xaa-Pro aminopeptidase
MASKLTSVRKACRINDAAFRETVKHFSRFKTERDVAKFLNNEIRRRGVKLAFRTIVANGPHAFELHHKPCKKRLKRGFTVIDFGAKVGKYCSDMTRTVFIGEPTKKELELYNLVRNVQTKCVRASRPGLPCSLLDNIGSRLLGKYAPNFIHAVGHGIDRKVHASPKISPRSPDKLQNGDVIAIEPGVYFKKRMGIRIEDTVLVSNKPRALTRFTTKLIKVQAK